MLDSYVDPADSMILWISNSYYYYAVGSACLWLSISYHLYCPFHLTFEKTNNADYISLVIKTIVNLLLKKLFFFFFFFLTYFQTLFKSFIKTNNSNKFIVCVLYVNHYHHLLLYVVFKHIKPNSIQTKKQIKCYLNFVHHISQVV